MRFKVDIERNNFKEIIDLWVKPIHGLDRFPKPIKCSEALKHELGRRVNRGNWYAVLGTHFAISPAKIGEEGYDTTWMAHCLDETIDLGIKHERE